MGTIHHKIYPRQRMLPSQTEGNSLNSNEIRHNDRVSGRLRRSLRFCFSTIRKTIRFTTRQDTILSLLLFAKRGEPIPELVNDRSLGTLCGIKRPRHAARHKGENKNRSHKFTHPIFPFVEWDSVRISPQQTMSSNPITTKTLYEPTALQNSFFNITTR